MHQFHYQADTLKTIFSELTTPNLKIGRYKNKIAAAFRCILLEPSPFHLKIEGRIAPPDKGWSFNVENELKGFLFQRFVTKSP